MAISKVVYKSSASATPVTWMDATSATALAADIMSPKTAMLADGVLTTGTGSGGGGGLVYEAGTYTPTEDVSTVTINFTNTHSTLPMCAFCIDASDTTASADSFLYFIISNWYAMFANTMSAAGATYYARTNGATKTASGTSTFNSNISSLNGTTTSSMAYYLSESWFKPYANAKYFRAGRTYKWIAVWAPTT